MRCRAECSSGREGIISYPNLTGNVKMSDRGRFGYEIREGIECVLTVPRDANIQTLESFKKIYNFSNYHIR